MGLLITLAEAKTYLQITFSTDDATLTDIITGVSKAIENHCKRSFGGVVAQADILDGQEVLIASRRPIVSITALADLTGKVNAEAVATGDGLTTSFPLALQGFPLIAGVARAVQISAGQSVAYDDGAGVLSGAGIASGAINYSTGIGSIVFSAAVPLGVGIKASYLPLAALVDATLYQVDLDAGLVRPIPEPPSNEQIPAGLFEFFDSQVTWGRGRNRFLLAYQNGYAACPDDVKHACKLEVAERYNRRDPLLREQVGDYSYEVDPGERGLSRVVEEKLSLYHEPTI
jgi:Phage gp6-like head-tail connector protein